MLAPDTTKADQALQHSISSSAVITVYAGAMRYAVSPLVDTTMPSWFDPVKASIAAAVANATNWMDDLCIDVTSAIPQSVITFAATFGTTSDTLSNLETEIVMSSGVATAEQKQQAVDAMAKLQTGVGDADASVAAVQARLLDLATLLQTDHDNLRTAAATVNANVPNGETISQKITADLGQDFLSVTPNGPCMVSVAIKSDVEITITQTAGSHPELLPYVIAQKLLGNAIADNEQATGAMSDVRAIWALMDGLVKDASSDLSMAADKDVLPILQQAEFSAARDVWNHLSEIAKTLMQAN